MINDHHYISTSESILNIHYSLPAFHLVLICHCVFPRDLGGRLLYHMTCTTCNEITANGTSTHCLVNLLSFLSLNCGRQTIQNICNAGSHCIHCNITRSLKQYLFFAVFFLELVFVVLLIEVIAWWNMTDVLKDWLWQDPDKYPC